MTSHNTTGKAEAWLSDIPLEPVRIDAAQAFLRLRGSMTVAVIGTLIGTDAERPEAVSYAAVNSTCDNAIGAITSLALAAIDTAVRDGSSRRSGIPLPMFPAESRSSTRPTTSSMPGCT